MDISFAGWDMQLFQVFPPVEKDPLRKSGTLTRSKDFTLTSSQWSYKNHKVVGIFGIPHLQAEVYRFSSFSTCGKVPTMERWNLDMPGRQHFDQWANEVRGTMQPLEFCRYLHCRLICETFPFFHLWKSPFPADGRRQEALDLSLWSPLTSKTPLELFEFLVCDTCNQCNTRTVPGSRVEWQISTGFPSASRWKDEVSYRQPDQKMSRQSFRGTPKTVWKNFTPFKSYRRKTEGGQKRPPWSCAWPKSAWSCEC